MLEGRRCRPAGPASCGRCKQGIAAAQRMTPPPDYLLLTDADIVYAPDVLRWLVAHAANEKLVLTSLMVKLRCESLAERSLIPAFIFFFQMLYPFAWVNRPGPRDRGRGRRLHAGARRRAAPGRRHRRHPQRLIDDCALAAALKAHGPIWLGLTDASHSIRPYPDSRGDPPHGGAHRPMRSCAIRRCCSPARSSGMALTYLAPPLAALFGTGTARIFGLAAWATDGARVPADAAVLSAVAALGACAAGHRHLLHALHARLRPAIRARQRRTCGRAASRPAGRMSSDAIRHCVPARATATRISRSPRG